MILSAVEDGVIDAILAENVIPGYAWIPVFSVVGPNTVEGTCVLMVSESCDTIKPPIHWGYTREPDGGVVPASRLTPSTSAHAGSHRTEQGDTKCQNSTSSLNCPSMTTT